MSAFLTAPHCSPKGERGFVSASSIIVGNGVYRGLDYRSFTPAITRAWPYSQLLWTRPSAVVYQTLGGEGSGRILINKLIFQGIIFQTFIILFFRHTAFHSKLITICINDFKNMKQVKVYIYIYWLCFLFVPLGSCNSVSYSLLYIGKSHLNALPFLRYEVYFLFPFKSV